MRALQGQAARRVIPALILLLMPLIAGCGTPGGQTIAPTSYAPTPGVLPAFSHIFVIVMENRAYSDIIGAPQAPYLNTLAKTYGLATSAYAVTHPSLPNYLALLGGNIFGIQSDCTTCFVHAPNLVDDLEASHKTWRAYMESLPQPCFVGDAYPYAQKHDPFIYFDDIRTSTSRCHQIVPLTRLQADLASNQVPNFVWITPNLCSDMHDCSIDVGDHWLASWMPRILASPAWRLGGALFITWDEGTTNDGCCRYAAGGRIVTLVISPLGKPHYASNVPYDHYSLLRTITDAWAMHELGHTADSATSAFSSFF
jgi:hypothetical protein